MNLQKIKFSILLIFLSVSIVHSQTISSLLSGSSSSRNARSSSSSSSGSKTLSESELQSSIAALLNDLLNKMITDSPQFSNETSCLPKDCIDGLIFDEISCSCVPKHDPECPPRFIYDSLLCRCVCGFEKVDCPNGFKWDENQCKCACPNSEICKPEFIWSEQECKCSCNLQKECHKNFTFDQQTCDCVCDQKIVDAGCPNGTVFDHTICQCVLGAQPSCPPGFNSKNFNSERIFGGTAAEDGQFPYMVDLSVLYRGEFYHICGGTLIHSNWIITAGHCAYYVQKLKLDLNVTLGVTDITNGPNKWSELVLNDDIIIHENYTDDGSTAVNDIALIKVRKTIFYSGDSGSPLVVRDDKLGDILVGIASYVDIGEVCKGVNNGPVVFMRISYFMDWIEGTTGLNFK